MSDFGCRISGDLRAVVRHPQVRLSLLAALGIACLVAAERGFEKVLAAAPNQVAAMGNLGVVYQRTHRPEKAIAIYKRALTVNPKDEKILLNLGLVYFKREDYAQAMPWFERVVALNASSQQGRQLLTTCQVYLDQLEPA